MDLIKEFWDFFKTRKKFWLLPILLIMLLLGIMLIFGQGSVVAPFIYAIF